MSKQYLTAIGVAFLLLAMVATPVFADTGAWGGPRGQPEPNTKYDDASVMWPTGNVKGVDKVYFNGFIFRSNYPVYGTDGWLTPYTGVEKFTGDVQPAGSAMHYDWHQFGALLGVWRDCNKDGYIGNSLLPANTGTWSTYPASTADVDTKVCDQGSLYNQDGWVNEFRAIGPNANFQGDESDFRCDTSSGEEEALRTCRNQYANTTAGTFHIHDEESMVWSDYSIPDGEWRPSRTVYPPRGTWDDSDSTLEHLDFTARGSRNTYVVDDFLEEQTDEEMPLDTTFDAIWAGKPNVGECDSKPEFGGGPDNTCGLYPMWQARRLTNDSYERDEEPEPLVRTFDEENDCQENEIPLPTEEKEVLDDEDLGTYYIPGSIYHKNVAPGVATNPLMHGSIAGTYENFRDGFENYDRKEQECGDGDGFANLESTDSGADSKTSSNNWFQYIEDDRYHGFEALGESDFPVNALGLRQGGYWRSFNLWLDRTGGTATRDILQTFYARITDDAFTSSDANPNPVDNIVANAVPGGSLTDDRYGQTHCPDDGADTIVNGWNCNPAKWKEKSSEDFGEMADMLPYVTIPYALRDTDCYNGSTGVTAPTGDDVRVSITTNCAEHT